jgi:hypothetical protein
MTEVLSITIEPVTDSPPNMGLTIKIKKYDTSYEAYDSEINEFNEYYGNITSKSSDSNYSNYSNYSNDIYNSNNDNYSTSGTPGSRVGVTFGHRQIDNTYEPLTPISPNRNTSIKITTNRIIHRDKKSSKPLRSPTAENVE